MSQEVDSGVSLQISVAPQDLPHARHILPHQLRQWGGQVDEVVFTLDLGDPSRRRRIQDKNVAEIEDLLAGLCARTPQARVVRVDYGPAAVANVRRCFFDAKTVPRKDCYGKAVYAYFFGLACSGHRYVLHVDSDMMFGGGSQTWTEEARRLFGQRPDIFSCSPLPGPPSREPFPRHVLRRHAGSRSPRVLAANAIPFAAPGIGGPAFCFSRISTRDFMVDRSRLTDTDLAIRARRASLRSLASTLARGRITHADLRWAPAETMLSRVMSARGMLRVDFLGRPPGMWSLHPPVHSEAFYRLLPDLIRRIETGDIPNGQRGDYDLNDSMVG